jgi:hypothetical protein
MKSQMSASRGSQVLKVREQAVVQGSGLRPRPVLRCENQGMRLLDVQVIGDQQVQTGHAQCCCDVAPVASCPHTQEMQEAGRTYVTSGLQQLAGALLPLGISRNLEASMQALMVRGYG